MLTEEDKKKRRGGWGSSDIPVICRVKKFGNIQETINRTRVELAGGIYPDTFKGNAATLRGDISEIAGIAWPKMFFKDWRLAEEVDKFAVHPEMPFLRSTIDAMYFTSEDKELPSVGVEVKSANSNATEDWGPWSTDIFKPAHKDFIEPAARVQATVHLACRPWLRKCLVIGLFVPDKGRRLEWGCYVINRHDSEEEIRAVEKVTKDSWIHFIDNGNDPVVDKNTATAEALTTLFPEAKRGLMETTEEQDRKFKKLVEAKHLWMERKKEADAELKKVDREIKAELEDYGSAAGAGYKIYFQNNKDRTTIDWKGIAIALNAPEDLIATHTRTSIGARPLKTYLSK